MSNSVAELVANCFNVSGVGGENPEKWKAVTAVSALEAKLEAMEELIVLYEQEFSDVAGLLMVHGWKASLENVQRGKELRARIAAAQEEKE